jgi:benzoyl-CoA reductase subunit B
MASAMAGANLPFEGYDRAKRLQGEITKKYFHRLLTAHDEGRKVGYAFVMANPIELFNVFDIVPLFPEITSLNISYRGGAPPLINLAEEMGYSTDACGYVKMGVASTVEGTSTSIGVLPKPDILMLTYSGCQIYIHWWEQYHYQTGAPVVVIDVPYVREFDGHVSPHDVAYVAAQIEETIPLLERATGKKFDEAKFRETIRLSQEAWKLWGQVIEMGKLVPCPMDAYFESIYYMAPITIARGTQECVDFYQVLLDEMNDRVDRGVGPTPREDYRLIYEGVPNYPFFKRFWNLFRQYNARGVAATYPKVAGMIDTGSFELDPDQPFQSLARYMIHAYCNWNMPMRTDLIEKYVKDYHADGVVIHSIKSCRSFSMGQGDIREYLAQNKNIPTLLIESDHVDPRYYSEAQLKNRVDAFFETLALRKGVR